MTSLSPVHTVGSQLSEVLTLHKGLNKEQAKEKAIEMLKLTGIPNRRTVLNSIHMNFLVVCSNVL